MTPPDVLRLGHDPAAATVGAGWEDDPDTHRAILDAHRGRADDLTRAVRDRLGLLVKQLETLPLSRGETADVVRKLLRAVPARAEAQAGGRGRRTG